MSLVKAASKRHGDEQKEQLAIQATPDPVISAAKGFPLSPIASVIGFLRAKDKRKAALRLSMANKDQMPAEERLNLIRQAKPNILTPVGTALAGSAAAGILSSFIPNKTIRAAVQLAGLAGGGYLGYRSNVKRKRALKKLLVRQGYTPEEAAYYVEG